MLWAPWNLSLPVLVSEGLAGEPEAVAFADGSAACGPSFTSPSRDGGKGDVRIQGPRPGSTRNATGGAAARSSEALGSWSTAADFYCSPRWCGPWTRRSRRVASFLVPLLTLALVSALFLLGRLWYLRRRYLRTARSRPQDVVPTAGSIIGDVVGRDELCRVIIADMRDGQTRRPHVVAARPRPTNPAQPLPCGAGHRATHPLRSPQP